LFDRCDYLFVHQGKQTDQHFRTKFRTESDKLRTEVSQQTVDFVSVAVIIRSSNL